MAKSHGGGATNSSVFSIPLLITLFFLFLVSTSLAQPTPSPPLPPPPITQKTSCSGVFVAYATDGGGFAIPPNDPSNQAYRFSSTLTVANNGRTELKAWRVFVGFQFDELLVSADKVVLADGTPLPAAVGNGTVFAGSSHPDLKTAIQTAGDATQMEVQVQLVGTRFGPPPNATNFSPLPANVSLSNDGYVCPDSRVEGNMRWTCCERRNSPTNSPPNQAPQSNFPPAQPADLSITYDVLNTYDTDYWAQVTISNSHPLARLDNWQLSWDWTRDEFIFAMKGAYPLSLDTSECIFGSQGQHYLKMDFSQALNCQRRPTVVDLPRERANDTDIGRIPFCCRNGTILPPVMDSSKAMSIFQMHVFKMPPDLNRTEFVVPQGWRIGTGASLSSDFQCGSPVQVRPTQFPDPSGLPSTRTAVATWRITCNVVTKPKGENPKCCVSFSAFYNASIIPCNTCACGGCNNNPTCSSNSQALLLPSRTLAIPFENRTTDSLAWATVNKKSVPDPLPCGDNCGVTIHWHLLSDFKDGWTVRMTLFNWGQMAFQDWFAVVQLDEKAATGFENVYSFNGTVLANSTNTVFFQGLPGLNFLLPLSPPGNPKKDYPVPGMQQSIMSFSKTKTPGIDLVSGDGFPTKVMFNGEECVIPTFLPSKGCRRLEGKNPAGFSFVLCLLVGIALLARQ